MTSYLRGLLFSALTAFLAVGCRGRAVDDLSSQNPEARDWVGVYASPSEIGGFSGTVLQIEWNDFSGSAFYDMQYYTDVGSPNDIVQDELHGSVLVEGDRLYLPRASGAYDPVDGKPRLYASLDRYTLRRINGRDVLMRDDALAAYERDGELYDYGVLIRVADEADWMLDLSTVKHPSIKVLYADPSKPWRDPFVHGPNQR